MDHASFTKTPASKYSVTIFIAIDTRCLARADATDMTMSNTLTDIHNGLAIMLKRHEARVLGNKMDSLEAILMAKI